MEAWYSTALDLEQSLSGALDSDVHIVVADVVKSFDTVDRGILDYVLRRIGLPGGFGMRIFARVMLRFKLSCGLGQSWTGDGAFRRGAQPQLYADNLKCVCGDDDDLLEAAWFTNTYIRLVGQTPAPS